MDLSNWLAEAVEQVERWQGGWGPFESHPSLAVDPAQVAAGLTELTGRLNHNYPFFHPRYAGQMLKPPHPVAVIVYVAAMLINPNNHALDGGPPTAEMERDVVDQLARMFRLPQHLGHLTTSGTMANLEALFVARELHPDRGVAYSADAHYTHQRMCHLLGLAGHPVATDRCGRMDLTALESLLRTEKIGTVVLTAGTTGLGAVDPIDEALSLRDTFGCRLHVDAAYGGFFALVADDSADGVGRAPFASIGDCDSVVVDPHKHGLQPYGCGAILFRDPAVGRFYRHDSPYTYFTSDDLHLGEVSLECSRAGAAAAALWLTMRLLPLTPAGLGEVLRPGRRAALKWWALLSGSTVLAPYQRPELDIVAYFPRRARLSEIDAVSSRVLRAGMDAAPEEAVFLATYGVRAADLCRRGHDVTADAETGRILRSVLMKPESEGWVDDLHRKVEALVGQETGRG